MQQVAACDYPTVGSGTGIVTAHVPLLVVEDRESGGRAGVFPGEGRFGGGFCGWGVYSPEIAANLAWMRDELFPPLAADQPLHAQLRPGGEPRAAARAGGARRTRVVLDRRPSS